MKNKKLLLIVSLALAMMMSLGGTLAYLQDTDSDVNTMTLGNVKIDQLEYERVVDDGKWVSTGKTDTYGYTPDKVQEFTQDKPLLPAVFQEGSIKWDDRIEGHQQSWGEVGASGSNQLFDDSVKNVQDKFVFVKNTGKTNAYVRTFIAYEVGALGEQISAADRPMDEFNKYIETNVNLNHWTWDEDSYDVVDINGNKYMVVSATYKGGKTNHANGILPGGEVSYPSLLQVYMKPTATNEDVIALDGNENGTYDILVLSQAIQADGFADAAAAFKTGFDNDADKPSDALLQDWFGDWETWGKTTVGSDAELAAAIEAGETEIVLKAGNYRMPAAAKGKTLTFIGESKDAVIEVVPAGQGEAGGQLDYNLDGSTVTFNNLTIKTNSQLYAGFARMSGTYNNCVIQNTYNLGTGNSVFNDCTFNITNEYLRVGGASTATFNKCVFNTDGRAILVFQDGTSVAQTVTVKDCAFNATAAAYTWDQKHVAAVSIDGTNGTYVVNLEGTNTVDSDFNGLWQIKTGEANVTVNE